MARSAAVLEGSAVLFEHHAERLEARGEHVAAARERCLATQASEAAARTRMKLRAHPSR